MKTNKWLFLIFLVLIQCTKEPNHSCISFPKVKDSYKYPIVPGMKEWQQLKSTDDAYKLCQLPDDIIKSISTQGLIDALIHAPLFTGFYHLSSILSALKWHGHYESFNSAKELFLREDAGNALVAYYKLVRLNCIPASWVINEDNERLMGLECLFTKQQILDKMGHTQKKEAVVALLSNYRKCPDNVNSIFPMIYLMFNDKYKPVLDFSKEHAKIFQNILNGYLLDYEEFEADLQIELVISFAECFTN